nr:sulfatase-like hydrolase/transferase [Pseudogemmobacter hezensis]
MVASQCGVPLLPEGGVKGLWQVIKNPPPSAPEGPADGPVPIWPILPGLICLGDLLFDSGYDQSFVMGAPGAFATTADFWLSHGYSKAIAQEELIGIYGKEAIADVTFDAFTEDKVVYDAARQQFAAHLAQPAPFYMTVATIGPHGVPSFLSSSCTADGKAIRTDDVALSARCLAVQTRDLIADLQEEYRLSGREGDLRIILQSDHLNHASARLPTAQQEANLVILIGGTGAGQQISQTGGMFDLYPTILDWMGFAPEGGRAGLGISLLQAPGGRMTEIWSEEVFTRIVARNMALFGKAWTPREG